MEERKKALNIVLERSLPLTGIRGSDERQTYIDGFLQTAFDTVVEWVKTGADPRPVCEFLENE